ncbi:hypothetical protein HHI36_008542 [Cryptolaemus montrouzieri]|uniref:Uncharacterized protein n=1 Tax=Cryptolaemus montrouzieri TaxID=559131 RepID=A0ABD2MSX1_9CUCU
MGLGVPCELKMAMLTAVQVACWVQSLADHSPQTADSSLAGQQTCPPTILSLRGPRFSRPNGGFALIDLMSSSFGICTHEFNTYISHGFVRGLCVPTELKLAILAAVQVAYWVQSLAYHSTQTAASLSSGQQACPPTNQSLRGSRFSCSNGGSALIDLMSSSFYICTHEFYTCISHGFVRGLGVAIELKLAMLTVVEVAY